MWVILFDKGVQIVENLANIRMSMIAAVEGKAHAHTEYALMANSIVAGESATCSDAPHFAGRIVLGEGVYTTWAYRVGARRTEHFLLNNQLISAEKSEG
tara:strand:+ start:12909 stop:13205 length:297 start_codon:yes stop_codon:yes gene_type:complete